MAMRHSVYDTDPHFSIDPITRTLKCESSKKTCLVKNDHNSERFTFEIPRTIEGHDMSKCNVIQVHYNNIDAQTKAQSKGVYTVTDMQIAEDADDVVICSWLISQNATTYAGKLSFLLRFSCVEPDGSVQYAWNTIPNSDISISDGIYNGEDAVEDYKDALQTWYHDLTVAMEENVASIERAAADGVNRIANIGGTIVSETEPQEEAVTTWVNPAENEEEIALLDSTDIAQELSDATDKVPSVALLKQIAEQGGGGADIEGLDEALDRIIAIQNSLIGGDV